MKKAELFSVHTVIHEGSVVDFNLQYGVPPGRYFLLGVPVRVGRAHWVVDMGDAARNRVARRYLDGALRRVIEVEHLIGTSRLDISFHPRCPPVQVQMGNCQRACA